MQARALRRRPDGHVWRGHHDERMTGGIISGISKVNLTNFNDTIKYAVTEVPAGTQVAMMPATATILSTRQRSRQPILHEKCRFLHKKPRIRDKNFNPSGNLVALS